MNFSKLKEISQEQLHNPCVGDYWHEMFTPICVIVERFKNHVVICKEKITYEESWTWDLDKLEIMSLENFKKWLTYDTESLKNKTWALCNKESHKWVNNVVLESK